jgi:serine/threonine protein phosphatase PrpC
MTNRKAKPTIAPPASAFTLKSAANTDVGHTRSRNEDRFLCDDTLQLYGVADGVGGLPGGAEAAEIAVSRVRRHVAESSGALDFTFITEGVINPGPLRW